MFVCVCVGVCMWVSVCVCVCVCVCVMEASSLIKYTRLSLGGYDT